MEETIDTLILAVRIAGLLLIALALAHIPIAKRFHWREECLRLSPFNGQAMLVHAFFIAFSVGLMGVLSLVWAPELAAPSALGLPITAGLTAFWAVRLYFQWFVYKRNLWRGKRLETLAHIGFSLFWLYLTIVFGCCLANNL